MTRDYPAFVTIKTFCGISGISQFEIRRRVRAGSLPTMRSGTKYLIDAAGALEAQFKFSQLRIATNMGTFPVVLKEALKLIGYDCGDCVKPIQPLSEEQRGKLRGVLTDMGLL